jgi:hypothetical protein
MLMVVKKLFDDKRYTTGLLIAWMLAVCSIFYSLGAFHMGYMHVGPGDETVFMGLNIDTWGKWSALAGFSFCNTCINEFISNALDPWFLNSLQDHKTRRIGYSHATCMWIVQIHCMYVHVMGVFSLFLFFSQVDFAIVRLLADWLVTGFSTAWFIQDKIYDPSMQNRPMHGDGAVSSEATADQGALDDAGIDDLDIELASLTGEAPPAPQKASPRIGKKSSVIDTLMNGPYERCGNKDPEASFSSSAP